MLDQSVKYGRDNSIPLFHQFNWVLEWEQVHNFEDKQEIHALSASNFLAKYLMVQILDKN